MITYILLFIIVILCIAVGYVVYKLLSLKTALKNFNPVINTTTNTIRYIGDVRLFSEEQDQTLSVNKEFLQTMVKKISYRISEYTKILHSNYRITGYNGENPIYGMKTDSEKWLEHGRMSWYEDILSDITHLIARN